MDITKLIENNTKLIRLYTPDEDLSPEELKKKRKFLYNKTQKAKEKKYRRYRKLENASKRRRRAGEYGFIERYQRCLQFEKSIWHVLRQSVGSSRVSPLEEWITSGIDEHLDRETMSLIRKDTKKWWTVDNVKIILNPRKLRNVNYIKPHTVVYDPYPSPTGTAEGGELLVDSKLSDPQPKVGPF